MTQNCVRNCGNCNCACDCNHTCSACDSSTCNCDNGNGECYNAGSPGADYSPDGEANYGTSEYNQTQGGGGGGGNESGGSSCFTKDTLIETETGFKRMDELIVGKDKVRTANGFKLIKEIFNDTYDSYYDIHFDDGTTVKVTEDHPVSLHNGHLKSIDGNLRNYNYQFISKMKIGDEFYNKKITDLIRIPGNDLTYLPIIED
jgi:hypothetical protein